MMFLVLLAVVGMVQDPADWDAVRRRSADLRVEMKYDEGLTVLETYRKTHPTFAGVYEELGRTHADAGRAIPPRTDADKAARRRHLEAAALAFGRVLEFSPSPSRLAQIESADLNGPFELNRPVEFERYTRRLVEANPAVLLFRTRLATMLADTGRLNEAAQVLHDARAVKPEPYPSNARGALALHMATFLGANPTLPLATVRQLVDDARAISTEESLRNPKDPDMELVRESCFRLEAQRLESDPARQAALTRSAAAARARYEKMSTAPR